ncbi:MAG: glutaminyl-peptide cyclotransferase [Acidobacteriota bacterium]
MARKSVNAQKAIAKKSSKLSVFIITVVIAAIIIATLVVMATREDQPAATEKPAVDKGATMAKEVSYEVVASYPHDQKAFLQGLVWHDGVFYESTGQFGQSSLRRVEFPSGKVVRKIDLADEYFGEGLAMVGDRLIQLTWQTHIGFVYERDTFRKVGEFKYPTEGWGLCYDGKYLILSDGSDTLTYMDATSFEPVKKLRVTMNNRAVRNLNELEFIEGEIWANVWHEDVVLRINTETGRVSSFLNLAGLHTSDAAAGGEDVLNGIAYDAAQKRIFISGKLWPKIYEIKLK